MPPFRRTPPRLPTQPKNPSRVHWAMASCGLATSSWRPIVHLQKVRQRLQGSAPPPAGGRPGPSAGGGRLALFVAGPCPGRRSARGARAGVFAMQGAAAGTIWIQHLEPALVADECVEVHLLPLTVACISSVRQLPHEPTPARGRRGAPGRPPWRNGGGARRRPAWPTRPHRESARGHAAHTRQGRLDRPRAEEAAGQVWRQVQDAPEDDGQSRLCWLVQEDRRVQRRRLLVRLQVPREEKAGGQVLARQDRA